MLSKIHLQRLQRWGVGAVFRSFKSELGLRPIYHHQSARVDGPLFIAVLAYHLVHTLRLQLKAQDIHLSWDSLRDQFDGQQRVTVVLHGDDGKIYHIQGHSAGAPPDDSLQRRGPPAPAGQDRDNRD